MSLSLWTDFVHETPVTKFTMHFNNLLDYWAYIVTLYFNYTYTRIFKTMCTFLSRHEVVTSYPSNRLIRVLNVGEFLDYR